MVTEQGSRTCSEHWRLRVIRPLVLITALASLLLAVPSVSAGDDGRIGFTVRDAPEPLVVDLLWPDAPERGEPLGSLPEGAIDTLVHDVLALVMRTGHSRVAVRFSQVPGETAQPHVLAQLLDRLQAEETKIEFAIWNLGSESWQGDGVQARLLDRVDAFVLARSLILHNGGVSETQFVRDSLGELLQASNGRAILMRTNGRWREIRASEQSDRVEILDPAATLRTGTRRGPLDWNSLDGPHAQRAAGSHGPASGAPSSDGGSGSGGGSGDGSSSSGGGGGGGGGGGSGSGGGVYGGSGGVAGGGAITGDSTIAFSPKTGQHGILVRCGGSPKTQQNPLGVATQMLVNPKAFFKKHVDRAKQLHAITGNARVVFHMINGWDTEGMIHSGAVLGAMPDARKVEFIKAVNELTAAGITVGVYFASRVPKSSTSVYIADVAPVEPFDFSNPAHLNMTVEQIMQPLLDIGVTEFWLDNASHPTHRHEIALLADHVRQRGGYVVMEASPRASTASGTLDLPVIAQIASASLNRFIYLNNDKKNDSWLPLPSHTELIAIISSHQTYDNSVPSNQQEQIAYLAAQTEKRLSQGFTVFNMEENLDEEYLAIIADWVN